MEFLVKCEPGGGIKLTFYFVSFKLLYINILRHGWCGTTRNLITGEKTEGMEEVDQEINYAHGWGVCGATCDTSHRRVR